MCARCMSSTVGDLTQANLLLRTLRVCCCALLHFRSTMSLSGQKRNPNYSQHRVKGKTGPGRRWCKCNQTLQADWRSDLRIHGKGTLNLDLEAWLTLCLLHDRGILTADWRTFYAMLRKAGQLIKWLKVHGVTCIKIASGHSQTSIAMSAAPLATKSSYRDG